MSAFFNTEEPEAKKSSSPDPLQKSGMPGAGMTLLLATLFLGTYAATAFWAQGESKNRAKLEKIEPVPIPVANAATSAPSPDATPAATEPPTVAPEPAPKPKAADSSEADKTPASATLIPAATPLPAASEPAATAELSAPLATPPLPNGSATPAAEELPPVPTPTVAPAEQ